MQQQIWSRIDYTSSSSPPIPALKNHSSAIDPDTGLLYIFGGYDGSRNHNSLFIFDTNTDTWVSNDLSSNSSLIPPGRNGHSCAIASGVLYIFGGWLGSGPYAASDAYALSLSSFQWSAIENVTPGPMNMHSSDYIPSLHSIYIFRGGNGREYFSELYDFNIDTWVFTVVDTTGDAPTPRANHASAAVEDSLLIFGGWDGKKRLCDIYVLNTITSVWSKPLISSNFVSPDRRAGASLTFVKPNVVYLFGGSGPSAKVYGDLYSFDIRKMAWEKFYNTDDDDELLNRAGHTCVYNRRMLYIFGGSKGSCYLNDVVKFDTDPVPVVSITETPTEKIQSSLSTFINSPTFSDVTFVVENEKFYCHKVILSLLSDRFRSMFTSGFKETTEREIEIKDVRADVFLVLITYLYSGLCPDVITTVRQCVEEEAEGTTDDGDCCGEELGFVLELLRTADAFLVDNLKHLCEHTLQLVVTKENVNDLLEAAERSNASQLTAVCMHFIRNLR